MSQFPKVLARMVEVHNLNRAGKVDGADLPDPFGAVARTFSRPAASPAGKPPYKSVAKLLGGLDGADIGGGTGRTCPSLWNGVALYYYLPRLVVWTCGGTILCKVAATSAGLNP